jgi:Tol biopolymer transport system component
MVTQHEGAPVPKVIDFGIAKATKQRLTEKTLFTRYAHIIGTPAYMSPEQAELSDVDIDTRSDIYSLGALLYELLTGTTPFSEQELRKAGYIEMQRVIREQEPTKPSTKLSTLGETLTDVAKHHGSTPDLLRKAVRGDLDWIIMKALEKARDRRYDTVSALTMDVDRHLKDEPILARAPGTVYCLRKFFCRHQFQVLASLIVSVLVVTLLAVFLVWNYKQRWWEREMFLMHRITLSRAINSFMYGDLDAALADLEPILDSEYVGAEAHRRYDETLKKIRNRVSSSTEKIKADPGDAENYLLRAQQYYCLREKENMIADMEMYVNILNPLEETNPHDLWFWDFLIGLWQSTPTNLGPTVNTLAHEGPGGITPDGLSLFLNSDRSGWPFDIWVTTRATTDDDWGTPQKLGEPISTDFWDGVPSLSADGLSLYFCSGRPGGYGGLNDIWLSTRKTLRDSWGTPVVLGESINSSGWEWTSCLSADGLSLYFGSDRQGGQGELDIWVTRRAAISEPWGEPENLGETINSPYRDFGPLVWADGLILFISSERPGGYGGRDIWVTTRKTKDAEWGTPVNLGPPINSSNFDQLPIISPDNSLLYFSSNRPGTYGGSDIWQVSMAPISESFQNVGNADLVQKSVEGNDGKEVVPASKD